VSLHFDLVASHVNILLIILPRSFSLLLLFPQMIVPDFTPKEGVKIATTDEEAREEVRRWQLASTSVGCKYLYGYGMNPFIP